MLRAVWLNGFEDLSDILKIREAVFQNELQLDYDFSLHDELSMHCVVHENEVPVACGRVILTDDIFLIDSVAVLKNHRFNRIGDFVMRLCIRKAFISGGTKQTALSVKQAAEFFKKLGFSFDKELGNNIVSLTREGDIF